MGRSYGMQIPAVANESSHEKIKRLKTTLPKLNSLQIKDSNIQVMYRQKYQGDNFFWRTGKRIGAGS